MNLNVCKNEARTSNRISYYITCLVNVLIDWSSCSSSSQCTLFHSAQEMVVSRLSNQHTHTKYSVHPDQQNMVHELFINQCFPFLFIQSGDCFVFIYLFFFRVPRSIQNNIIFLSIQNNMQNNIQPHPYIAIECMAVCIFWKIESTVAGLRPNGIVSIELIFPWVMDILQFLVFPI